MENIELKSVRSADDINDLVDLMNTEEGIKEIFGNRIDRIMTSAYRFLIKYSEKIIGFINLVVEDNNKRFLFIDMGIKKEYRGKGIGTASIKKLKELLKENNIDTYVIGETKVTNKGGNQVIDNNGCLLMKFEDKNIYLLQNERAKEFIDDNSYDKLKEHFNKQYKKNKIVVK